MSGDKRRWFFEWALTTNMRPFMVILGTFTAAWGLWLSVPWSITFSNPIYDAVRFFATENIWGGLLLVVGIGEIYHAFRPIGWAALIIAAISLSLWVFIFILFVISAPYTTAMPVYAQVVIWNGWLLYRIQGERISGRSHIK